MNDRLVSGLIIAGMGAVNLCVVRRTGSQLVAGNLLAAAFLAR